MKTFVRNLHSFFVPLAFFFAMGFFLPVTPRASKSLFFANLQKDEMLKNTLGPRIIFIGGSNLSFSLNSQMIKDSLKLNPINTAVSAHCGLQYMLDNTIQYIKENDIVILVPEYFHLFNDYNEASQELLRTVFEVNPSKFKLLNPIQLINIIPHIPEYTLSKIKPTEYFNVTESDCYSVNSFNQYGDAVAHWDRPGRKFSPYSIQGTLNLLVIQAIREFQSEIEKKNAVLLISFPSYQESSFMKSAEKINLVEDAYKSNGFTVLGNPRRYMFPDSLMFDTPYHLIKKGVDQRTVLFIEDFKKTDYAIK